MRNLLAVNIGLFLAIEQHNTKYSTTYTSIDIVVLSCLYLSPSQLLTSAELSNRLHIDTGTLSPVVDGLRLARVLSPINSIGVPVWSITSAGFELLNSIYYYTNNTDFDALKV